MGNEKYRTIAEEVLKAVGGKENVARAIHCMTRLRINLKDSEKIELEQAQKIDGVLSVVEAGGQYQFVIGPKVAEVYAKFCELADLEVEKPIDENLEEDKKEKLTPKKIGNNILNYIAGSISPLLPVIVAAALFKTIASLLGPDIIGVISDKSNLYQVLNIMYDAGFYFLPIYLGYTAAKKLGTNPILGLFMGGLLEVPSLVKIAEAGGKFSVYGIPCTVYNYAQTVVPILLSVWVLKYVEKIVQKYMPEMLAAIFTPFVTMAIMLPVSLCVTAPLGTIVGNAIGKGLVTFGNVGGVFAMIVIAVVWEFLIMTGMHGVVALTAISMLMTNGSESLFMPVMAVANYAAFGMTLGAFLRIRDKNEKSIAFGSLVAGTLGGVTEPALFGIGLKYRRPFIGMMIGAAVGGAYVGLTHVIVYIVASSNVLMIFGFAGGTAANMINGTIACVISFVIAVIVTYITGFKKDDPAVAKTK